MIEPGRTKVFVCTAAGVSEECFASLRVSLTSSGFDVYPRRDLIRPGMNAKNIIERQLREAALYLVLKLNDDSQSWNGDVLSRLKVVNAQQTPRILPVIQSPATLSGMVDFLLELEPIYLKADALSTGNPGELEGVIKALDGLLSLSVTSEDGTRVYGDIGYLTELTVENFFGFREKQVLRLCLEDGKPARWNVILGDNGAGKTTLLRAIAACSAAAPMAWRNAAVDCRISVARSLTGEGHGFVTSGAATTYDDLRPLVFGYGAGRRAQPARLSSDLSSPSATLFDENVDLPNAEEWLLQSDHSRLADGSTAARRHHADMLDVLIKLLPDVKSIEVHSKDNRARAMVRMHGDWHPMTAMSLGYKTALTWMVDLARRLFDRYPKSAAPLKEPVVVLIDEIDLHLHPHWQRLLLELLNQTFTQAQFIVTAHSPLVVQAAPHANLALLRRDNDRIIIDNDRDYVRHWRVDQILASELFGSQPVHGAEVQALLTRRAAILSEGKDDVNKQELDAIDEQLRNVPTASNPEDQEAMNLIRQAAAIIKNKVQ